VASSRCSTGGNRPRNPLNTRFSGFQSQSVLWGREKNSVPSVRKRTLPTERPPVVGEVSVNFFRYRVPRDQRDGSLRPYSRLYRSEPLVVFQIAPQLYSRGSVNPVPDPILLRKCGSAGNRTRTSGSVVRNTDHY
jgi:hypothetical protein